MLYRDDPTIFAWETGNELDAPPEWTARIAARLKHLDPNHLVIDGRALHGVPEASLSDPNVDIVTTHHYPNVGNNNAESVAQEAAKARGKRPYFVGEFGFMSPDEAERVLATVIDERVTGALYWSLRSHRRRAGSTGTRSTRVTVCSRPSTGRALRRARATKNDALLTSSATALTEFAGWTSRGSILPRRHSSCRWSSRAC